MLDSLLLKLKSDVTHVTAVQPSNSKASACNGNKASDVTGVTDSIQGVGLVTSETSCNGSAVTPKPAPIQACTLVTSVTSKNSNDETAIREWLTRIGENDPAIIADTLWRCRAYPSCRAYFLGRSGE